MARRITGARRYAQAAFEAGRASGTLDAWEHDLAVVGQAQADPQLRRLLTHPGVAFADKERVVRRVLSEAIGPQPLNLVLLMVRRGRPGAIERMIDRFTALLRRERHVALVEVRTALPLDDGQRGALAERLTAITGERIELAEAVDPALIGGIAVRIGDTLYDASVRSRLERLRARLTTV